ncbi:MAG: hypothetical protein M0R06_26230 [Sphaerochaeta sp.]|nr:hypothetical protein [Sphaerochaeta sp.]
MWPLRNLRCFCDTGDEWHALVMGFCFPLWLWAFILVYDGGNAYKLWREEPWYCGVGMLLRLILLIGVLL